MPVSHSESNDSLEEAKAIPQLMATPEEITEIKTIPERINCVSQCIPYSKSFNIPRIKTDTEKKDNVVIDQAKSCLHDSNVSETLIPEQGKVDNVNMPSIKPALVENLNVSPQPESSNIFVNNGPNHEKDNDASITEAASNIFDKISEMDTPTEDEQMPSSSTTTAGSLPELSPLTSNTKKLVARVKPLPTNNTSTQRDSDDDIEILEIVNINKSPKKQYTEAFLNSDGSVIDMHNHVIGHLDPEKTKGIMLKQGEVGEPLIKLPKGAVNFIYKVGSSKRKITLSKDDMRKDSAVSKEDSSKKIKRKKSLKRKPKNLVVKKYNLPDRAKKLKEDGFYKRFEEKVEEDILNASDDDYDDPSYECEVVDPVEVSSFDDNSSSSESNGTDSDTTSNETNGRDSNSSSNESNGTDSNSIEVLEMDPKCEEKDNSDAESINLQNIPTTSGEIIVKEGTSTTDKEAEPSNKKKKRLMPLSVRLKKEEEKRRRMESKSKAELETETHVL